MTDALDDIRRDLIAMRELVPSGADRPSEAADIDAAIADALAIVDRSRGELRFGFRGGPPPRECT